MYPPLRSTWVKDFHLIDPTDLAYPSTSAQRKTSQVCPTSHAGMTKMPSRTRRLILHFATRLRAREQTTTTVQDEVLDWMTRNAQATFRESISASAGYWCNISKAANGYILRQFRDSIVTKFSMLEKARAELRWSTRVDNFDVDAEDQGGQHWHRLKHCLESLLADVDKILREKAMEVQIQMTKIQIEESRTAIRQAETVKRLTRLAFIFIPISATCSAFGMNVQELAHTPPPVWVSLLVILGVTFTTIVCSMEKTLDVILGVWKITGVFFTKRMLRNPIYVWRHLKGRSMHDESGEITAPRLPELSRIRLAGYSWPLRPILRLILELKPLLKFPLVVIDKLARIGRRHRKQYHKDRQPVGTSDTSPL